MDHNNSRNIKKGEELSYDYGFGYDVDYKQFPCKCQIAELCWIHCSRRLSDGELIKNLKKIILELINNFSQKQTMSRCWEGHNYSSFLI